jgi:hypothetical protein
MVFEFKWLFSKRTKNYAVLTGLAYLPHSEVNRKWKRLNIANYLTGSAQESYRNFIVHPNRHELHVKLEGPDRQALLWGYPKIEILGLSRFYDGDIRKWRICPSVQSL